jgi:hypothetical protein
MNKLGCLFLFFFFFHLQGLPQRWVRTLVKSDVISQQAQSTAVKNALAKAFSTSTLTAKKALRDMEISPYDIQKITSRNSTSELLQLTKLMDGKLPSTIRSVFADLARNKEGKSKNFINALIRDPALLKSYERVSSSLSVKYRTNIRVLRDINNGVIPIQLNTTNSSYLDKSIAGIIYRSRIISIGGIKYQGVFPDFSEVRKFYTILPKNLYGASDDAQMKNVTKYLRKKIKENPELAKKYTKEQLEAISNGNKKIPDLTWHHKEAPIGAMELVSTKLHNAVSHDGGKAFWNAGNR